MKLDDIGVVVLSHGRKNKLEKSLRSYEENGLTDMVGDNFVFFNSIGPEDVKLIENDYKKFEYGGHQQNCGIAWGMIKGITECNTKYVLFLENDFELQATAEDIYLQLEMGYRNIKNGKIDVIKYRRLDDYKRTCNETVNWHKKGGRKSVEHTASKHIGFTVEENFGYDNSDICTLIDCVKGRYLWSMLSKDAGWSNNPFLCKKEWFLELAYKIGFEEMEHAPNDRNPDFEQQLQPDNWHDENYKIGILPGLFAHQADGRTFGFYE